MSEHHKTFRKTCILTWFCWFSCSLLFVRSFVHLPYQRNEVNDGVCTFCGLCGRCVNFVNFITLFVLLSFGILDRENARLSFSRNTQKFSTSATGKIREQEQNFGKNRSCNTVRANETHR